MSSRDTTRGRGVSASRERQEESGGRVLYQMIGGTDKVVNDRFTVEEEEIIFGCVFIRRRGSCVRRPSRPKYLTHDDGFDTNLLREADIQFYVPKTTSEKIQYRAVQYGVRVVKANYVLPRQQIVPLRL